MPTDPAVPSTCYPVGVPHEMAPVRPIDWAAAVVILLFLALLYFLNRRRVENGPY